MGRKVKNMEEKQTLEDICDSYAKKVEELKAMYFKDEEKAQVMKSSIKDELINIDQSDKFYLEKKKELYKTLMNGAYGKMLKLWDESEGEKNECRKVDFECKNYL